MHVVLKLPRGASVRIDLEGDAQFVVAHHDPEFKPVGAMTAAVRVMANSPDSTGRTDVIYETLDGSSFSGVIETPEERIADYDAGTEIVERFAAPEPPASPPRALGAGMSLDALLAAAVAPPADTGVTPSAPLVEQPGMPAAPAPAAAPAEALETARSALEQLSAPPGQPLAAAPRDGRAIVLMREGQQGVLETETARWSSEFGRQLWVDSSGDTLGLDDGFVSWREMTPEEREEWAQSLA